MNEDKVAKGLSNWLSKFVFIFAVSGLIYGLNSELGLYEGFGFWASVMMICIIELVIDRVKRLIK